jgi:hypothetical protein
MTGLVEQHFYEELIDGVVFGNEDSKFSVAKSDAPVGICDLNNGGLLADLATDGEIERAAFPRLTIDAEFAPHEFHELLAYGES